MTWKRMFFSLLSKNLLLLIRNSLFPIRKSILIGVFEVTIFHFSNLSTRFWLVNDTKDQFFVCKNINTKKGQKRVLRVAKWKFVTSKTPIKIDFLIRNSEFRTKSNKFLLNELKNMCFPVTAYYIAYILKLWKILGTYW